MRFAQASTVGTASTPSAAMGRTVPVHARRRRLSLAIAALTTIPLAAGCQAASTSSSPAGQKTAITVAAIKGVDTAPLYIAQKSGAFSRAGLDVTIRPYTSVGQELRALTKGSIGIAAGDYVDFFSLVGQSKRPFLSVVADGYHAAPGVMEVLTYPGSGISTPADLAHRTVGTTEPQDVAIKGSRPYSLETLATDSVLSNNGVDPSLVKWKPMQASKLIGALSSHEVSAILVQEPYILQAESTLGAVAVLDACSGATANLPLSGYFATTGFVRQHAAAVSEFRSVLQHAQEAAVLPGPVRAQLASDPGMSMHLPDGTSLSRLQSASLITIGSYPTSLNAASLQRVADLMFSAEILTQTLAVSSMIAH